MTRTSSSRTDITIKCGGVGVISTPDALDMLCCKSLVEETYCFLALSQGSVAEAFNVALHRFKSGQVPVMNATDMASRGLDIPTLDHAMNYGIPK